MKTHAYAVEIVEKLKREGHVAYFAGGWVRDYLMNHPSNDIDIATDAPPEKILDYFPRTLPVGLAFGVILVLVDGKQFEVSTFRKDFRYLDGRHPEHIEFSNAEEDAKRRDFTINGMFYDPIEKVIHDFVGGDNDIKARIIRAIGNPHERFVEDRLRMIRAIRFAARFEFLIDQETQQAIVENAETLFPAVAKERVWQEFNKMTKHPRFDWAISEMYRLGLLQVIFPTLKDVGLHRIREMTHGFKHFPEECPTVLYLLELFPREPLETVLDIFRQLKISNRELKLIELIYAARNLVEKEEQGKEIESREWVYFYAHPDSDRCLRVIAASLADDKREAFIRKQCLRREELSSHIERVQLGKPLVTAALLQAHGISPGKPMGILLQEAERMVINHNRDSAAEIIDMLKQSSHWPT